MPWGSSLLPGVPWFWRSRKLRLSSEVRIRELRLSSEVDPGGRNGIRDTDIVVTVLSIHHMFSTIKMTSFTNKVKLERRNHVRHGLRTSRSNGRMAKGFWEGIK